MKYAILIFIFFLISCKTNKEDRSKSQISGKTIFIESDCSACHVKTDSEIPLFFKFRKRADKLSNMQQIKLLKQSLGSDVHVRNNFLDRKISDDELIELLNFIMKEDKKIIITDHK